MIRRQTPPPSEPLVDFLPDWEVHLRAKGCAKGTIVSYLGVARAFCSYLDEEGIPADLQAITRAAVERFIADLRDRLSPATTAKNYRSLQQLFRAPCGYTPSGWLHSI